MPALSNGEAIGDAIKAAVDGARIRKPDVPVGLESDADVLVPTVKRKTPSVPDGQKQGLPQIVISVGAEPATEYLTATEKLRKYPAAVTIVTDEGQWAADDPTLRYWRDLIDKAVDTRNAFRGVPGFSSVDASGGPPFDLSALDKDLNYSIQSFTVSVIEPRT